MIVCDKCMTNPADLGTIYVEVAGNRQGIDICRDCFRAMFSGIEVARKAFCAQVNFDKDDRGNIEEKLLAEKNSEMLKDAPTKPERESTAFERQRSISDFHPREVAIGRMAWMAENLVLADDGEGIYRDDGNQEAYYTYDAAVRIAGKIPGWRLPNKDEWDSMIRYVNACQDVGQLLVGQLLDSGTNASGMSIKLAGSMSRISTPTATNRTLYEYGVSARFWTSDENLDLPSDAWYRYFDKGDFREFSGNKSVNMLSVRLVRDT